MSSHDPSTNSNAAHLPNHSLFSNLKNYTFYLFSSGTDHTYAKSQLSPLVIWNTQFILGGASGGFLTSTYISAKHQSRIFFAENLHRQPRMKIGWYYYHKHKNYAMIDAGIRGGLKGALKFGGMFMGFAMIESGLERLMGKESGWCAVGAGVLSAVGVVLLGGLGRQYGKYAIVYGLGTGLFMGLSHETHALVFGTSIRYPLEKRITWYENEFIMKWLN